MSATQAHLDQVEQEILSLQTQLSSLNSELADLKHQAELVLAQLLSAQELKRTLEAA